MNKNLLMFGCLCILAIGSLFSSFYNRKEFKEEMVAMKQSHDSAFYKTRNQVAILEYGMDQDGVRRRKILAVEAIIKSVNDTLSVDLIHIISKTVVDETEKPTPVQFPLLCALLAKESTFDPTKISPSGARGLGQTVKITTEFICEKLKIPYTDKIAHDPIFGVKAAWYYLNYCIGNNNGNIELGLAEYNNGPQYGSWRYKCFLKKQSGITLDSLENYGAENISEETKIFAPIILSSEKRFSKFIDNISLFIDKDSSKVSFPSYKNKHKNLDIK